MALGLEHRGNFAPLRLPERKKRGATARGPCGIGGVVRRLLPTAFWPECYLYQRITFSSLSVPHLVQPTAPSSMQTCRFCFPQDKRLCVFFHTNQRRAPR